MSGSGDSCLPPRNSWLIVGIYYSSLNHAMRNALPRHRRTAYPVLSSRDRRYDFLRAPTMANIAPCGSVACTMNMPPGTSIGPCDT
jgi:hypothetical protein